jgi:uncharacterized membrane-anchored protein
MFAVSWFLFIALTISTSVVWLLDNGGSIAILWLGYEVQVDIMTAISLTILFALIVFLLSYLLARILSFRFPKFLKVFSQKSHVRKLEKLESKDQEGLEILTKILLAIELGDLRIAKSLQKKAKNLVRNSDLNNFIQGKIALANEDFSKASEFFAQLDKDESAKVLAQKLKLKITSSDEEGL